MKSITYRALYQTPDFVQPETITVSARSINSGFRKATKRALEGLPEGWEITSLTFWEVH